MRSPPFDLSRACYIWALCCGGVGWFATFLAMTSPVHSEGSGGFSPVPSNFGVILVGMAVTVLMHVAALVLLAIGVAKGGTSGRPKRFIIPVCLVSITPLAIAVFLWVLSGAHLSW